jgi:hypothetical protein
LPAVIVVTEQFEKLAAKILSARNVPESIAIHVKGNPEFISDEKLTGVAEEVLLEAVARLTGKER